jgi:hypothetical protein
MDSKTKNTEMDLHPDAWQRFERAVDAAVKSPPQHRVKSKRKTTKSPAKRKAKAR